jgi:pimeloyl-ACP methyl ester carboxylesterase
MPQFVYHRTRLFYREQGRGPLLLILHGNTASSAGHLRDLAHFGQHHRAVAPDLLGTGQSHRLDPWPDDWWLQNAWAAVALLDHLAEERAIVVGTSGGAVVALLMARHAPARVRAVIADSCVARQPPEILRAAVADRRRRHPDAVAFWQTMHGQDWEQVVEADSDLMLRLAQRDGRFFQQPLSGVRCPVLLTGSLQDSMLFEGATQMVAMAEQIPESQLVLINSGHHPLIWSRPRHFWRIADSFLAGLQEETGI